MFIFNSITKFTSLWNIKLIQLPDLQVCQTLYCERCIQLRELQDLPVCQTLDWRDCTNLTYTLDYLTRHPNIADKLKDCGKLDDSLTKASRGGIFNKKQLYEYKLMKYQYKLQQL
jgi:hypothetical protein